MLLRTPAVKRWISAEPLLGPLELQMQLRHPQPRMYIHRAIDEDYPSLDWVVAGCESGPNRRECRYAWLTSLVEQCEAMSTPMFMKQVPVGDNDVACTDIDKFPVHLRVREYPKC